MLFFQNLLDKGACKRQKAVFQASLLASLPLTKVLLRVPDAVWQASYGKKLQVYEIVSL